jgi:energy-coupling factor transport system permease protein
MVISLAIRFVPTLLDESQKILNAQASRGVDFKNGNIADKGKALVSLVIPMFLISFIKANDLAAAMEVRNYNPRYRRTQYRSYHVAKIDIFALLLTFIILGFVIMLLSNNLFISIFSKSDLLLSYN